MLQKVYKSLFWVGYVAILITAIIPISGNLNKIKIGSEAFHLRFDHLIHFFIYLLFSIYYLIGQKKELYLFSSNSIIKFILLILFIAILTELVQLWVPKRTFNVYDLISNILGIIVGTGLTIINRVR